MAVADGVPVYCTDGRRFGELKHVLADEACRRTAARLAGDIRALDGPARAAEAVEAVCAR